MLVLLASVAWVRQWHGERIQFPCDNTKAVFALRNYSCHDKLVMHLLRLLTFAAAHILFTWTTIHIPGKSSHVADALSRNNLLTARFFHQPLRLSPDQVSVQFLALLQPSDIDWSSPSWRSRLVDSFRPV